MKKITLCAFACTLILLGCSEGSSTLKAGFSIFDNGDTNLGKMLGASSRGLAVMTNKDFIVDLDWKGEIVGGTGRYYSSTGPKTFGTLYYTTADCTGAAYSDSGELSIYEKTLIIISTSLTEKSFYKNKIADSKEVTLLSKKMYQGDNPKTETVEPAAMPCSVIEPNDGKTVVSPGHALELEPTTRAEIGLPETIQAPLTIKNN